MRVICPHCGSKAVIEHRENLTETTCDLYCRCKNVKGCSASFVFVLSYKHDLNPPISDTYQMALSLVKALRGDDLKRLQADLFHQ